MNCSETVYVLLQKGVCNLNTKVISENDVTNLYQYCNSISESEDFEKYSKPLVWIGIYIAAATIVCIFAMVADLLHGFRSRKFWFPCKYFALNAASITVIGVVMKLPVDLNTPMTGAVDQIAKMGSMAFMCTMMANLMPSLASMNDMELFANIVGLVILVITVIVNIFIQLKTGLIKDQYFKTYEIYMYAGTMLSLLLIFISSAITIPTSKLILESKYQAAHKKASEDKNCEHFTTSTVEELIQHVRRYWVMARTSNPQFVLASIQFCSAAGIICVPIIVIHFHAIAPIYKDYKAYESDYKWSTLFILITQCIGIVVGVIAPIFRCFATLSFKLSLEWSMNHIEVFQVEEYWIQKLSDWKQRPFAFAFDGHLSQTLVRKLKGIFLTTCIGFQMVIVVSCKMIGLIPIGVVIFVVYCFNYLKPLKRMFFERLSATSSSGKAKGELEKNDRNEEMRNYILHLHDDIKLSKRTLKSISNSMNRFIQKAENQPPKYLLKLLEKSEGFEGVKNFDCDQDTLHHLKILNCWSLPVVTLTCIAITLPNIPKKTVDKLFKKVNEALWYMHLVEETLNNEDKYTNIQGATMILWYEVEDKRMWLENSLKRKDHKGKKSSEILEWFSEKAKEIVVNFTPEINKITKGEQVNIPPKLILANSMYRITQTIVLDYKSNTEHIHDDQLFDKLLGNIADIVAACLTNLPRVVGMKCHESTIEQRESSVEAATKLLGRTKKIIEHIKVSKLPPMDPDHMAFIDEWRDHFKPPA